MRKTSRSWAPLEDQLIAASNSALVEVIRTLRPYREAIVLIGSHDRMSSKIFISYLNTLKRECGRFVLFYDGAPWHTLGTVKKFLEKNEKAITPVRFPRCSPELNPAEECWNQAKRDLLGSTVPESFGRMKKSVSNYFRRKKFNLNIANYLCP